MDGRKGQKRLVLSKRNIVIPAPDGSASVRLRAGLMETVPDWAANTEYFKALVADGGMCANDYLMEKQANVLNQTVICPENREGTITGVGYLMCLSLGLFGSLEEIPQSFRERRIAPAQEDVEGYAQWKRAVDATIHFYK